MVNLFVVWLLVGWLVGWLECWLVGRKGRLVGSVGRVRRGGWGFGWLGGFAGLMVLAGWGVG